MLTASFSAQDPEAGLVYSSSSAVIADDPLFLLLAQSGHPAMSAHFGNVRDDTTCRRDVHRALF